MSILRPRHGFQSPFRAPSEIIERVLDLLRARADKPVEEARVPAWVDACYVPIAAAWMADVERMLEERGFGAWERHRTEPRRRAPPTRPLARHRA